MAESGSSNDPAEADPGTGPVTGVVPDGRYLGENGRWWVDLRVDVGQSRAVSLDLHTLARYPQQLSGRTDPRGFDPAADTWAVLWDRGRAGDAAGTLTLRPDPQTPGRVEVQLRVEAAGSGRGRAEALEVAATLDRVGDRFRTLGVEIEVEKGVRPPGPVVIGERPVSLESALGEAGIAVRPAGATSEIEPPAGGTWAGADVLQALHRAMQGAAQTSLREPGFEARLLYLSRSDRPGLCGVMFDIEDDLPRQGAAVFVDEIRDRVPEAEADARILQAAVHEVGHVLNLTHRFATGAWDSLSFMNYDWCYRGGGHAQEYQSRFAWRFDADERTFLRHAFRRDVVPGGAQFGADEYWLRAADAAVDESSTRGLRLWLTSSDAPAAGQPLTLRPGDPLFLSVSLANLGDRATVVPRHVLDHKAGHLSIVVERVHGRGDAGPLFSPFMRRCFAAGTLAEKPPWLLQLGPGQSLHENVNLTFGSRGSTFTEPGTYAVTPVLTLPPSPGLPQGLRVRGGTRQVIVEKPETAAGAGRFDAAPAALAVALGGTVGRGDLTEALAKARRDAGPNDARTHAVLDRIDGLQARREGRLETAASLLGRSVDQGERVFDPHTLEQTRRLALRTEHAAAQEAARRAVSVVVPAVPAGTTSLAVTAAAPAAVVEFHWIGTDGPQTTRVPGVLRVDGDGKGWSVLSPTDRLPQAADALPDLAAVIVVSSEDGTVERLPASQVDLPRRPDGSPVIALVWLPRPVRGTPSPILPAGATTAPASANSPDVWGLLVREGLAPAGLAELTATQLQPWTAATDAALESVALADANLPGPAVSIDHEIPGIDEVAGWICRLVRICQERPEQNPDGVEGPWLDRYPYDPRLPFWPPTPQTSKGEAPTPTGFDAAQTTE